MVIDAHAHIFPKVQGLIAAGQTKGLGYGRVKVGNEEIQVMPPLSEKTVHTPEMLLSHMRWTGVDKAVLLQGPFYGECNQYVRDAVEAYPDCFSGFAYLDPWDPDSHEKFKFVSSEKSFAGVKLECSEATGLLGIHRAARLDDANVAWLWEALERHGMVLVIDLGAVGSTSYQTEAMRGIAIEHPGLTIVIAHLGQPNPAVESDEAKWKLWHQQVDLGFLPNVYFDLASLPAYVASEGYPFPTVSKYLRIAIEKIGPSKVMWGTDIPALLAHATYKQLLQASRRHLDFLSDSEVAMVLGENAARLYWRKRSF